MDRSYADQCRCSKMRSQVYNYRRDPGERWGNPDRRAGEARDPFRARGAEPLSLPVCDQTTIGGQRKSSALECFPPERVRLVDNFLCGLGRPGKRDGLAKEQLVVIQHEDRVPETA